MQNNNKNVSETNGVTGKGSGRKNLLIICVAVFLLAAISAVELQKYFAPVFITSGAVETKEQQLPDGSDVLLNVNTRISLNEEWKKDEYREVWVRGEAFFNVLKVADTAGLVIHTDQFDIVASQAKCNVMNKNKTANAWLQEGSAYILTHDSKAKRIDFEPGDYVEFSTHRIIKKTKAGAEIIAWKRKKTGA